MYKKIIFAGLFILVLAVAYYAISPIFKNTQLDEPAPQVTSLPLVTITDAEKIDTKDKMVAETIPEKKIVAPVALTAIVSGTPGHPATGTVRIIKSDVGATLRYENFKTINGPDLYVYLSKDLKASSFVNLGRLKATEGNVNYDIPKDVNIDDYSYVLVWCEDFSVLFNSAEI